METRLSSINSTKYLVLALWFIPAAIVTWGVHEFAHWAMGEMLGYDMWISFNQAGLDHGQYRATIHEILVSLAGPAVTWVQAIVAYVLLRRSKKVWLYPFLFLTLWMRAVAMGISFISLPNDEASSSLLMGLPMFLLPLLSVLGLLFITYLGSRALNIGWKGNALSYLMASLVTTAIVFADKMVFP
ncbi:hypothetical protein HQ496_06900 [bacterium]|nr:hypothetical protein [bacterium]